jgi:hypothetical protein
MTLYDIHKIIPPVLFAFVFGLFAYFYFKSRSLLEVEKGLAPIYNVRCVSYLDGLRHVFTRFAIYENFLVVSSRKKIVLAYDEIRSVKQGRVLWRKSLDIYHDKARLPSISLLLRDIQTPMRMIQGKIDQMSV